MPLVVHRQPLCVALGTWSVVQNLSLAASENALFLRHNQEQQYYLRAAGA